jgi:hypothetical protein
MTKKLKLYKHKWYLKNRKRLLRKNKIYQKKYNKLNKEKVRKRKQKYWKKYYKKNKVRILLKHRKYLRKYYRKNKKKMLKQMHERYQKNKKSINKRNYARKVKRLKKDPIFKLTENLRNRITQAIRKNAKKGSAVRDLGCTIMFLKTYIEKKFYGQMSWDNWGTYWQLDHIVALWKFDLTDRKQFLKAVNYKNLQPLTIPDHKKKTAKEVNEFFKMLKKDHE